VTFDILNRLGMCAVCGKPMLRAARNQKVHAGECAKRAKAEASRRAHQKRLERRGNGVRPALSH
jgi:hypothetical protein